MQLDSLRDLLIEQLQDVYSAENQITEALPKMITKVKSAQLKKAFETHLKETQEQIKRLDKVFQILGEKPKSHTCKAMQGIIKESEEMLKANIEAEVLDAGLIACAQRVEHYEIAVYGTVRVYAKHLGETEVEKLLTQTLEEEKTTDVKLTEIAEMSVNIKAEQA